MERKYRQQLTAQIARGQAATLPFIIAGAATIARGAGATYWLVPGVVLSFVVAFNNAWILLIEINR